LLQLTARTKQTSIKAACSKSAQEKIFHFFRSHPEFHPQFHPRSNEFDFKSGQAQAL
jgi:hypothetical protein